MSKEITRAQQMRFERLQELVGKTIVAVNKQGPKIDDVTLEFSDGSWASFEIERPTRQLDVQGSDYTVGLTTSWED